MNKRNYRYLINDSSLPFTLSYPAALFIKATLLFNLIVFKQNFILRGLSFFTNDITIT